jgi:hypothetical protein
MQGYLPGYELDPTTWAYLSSLLTIGVFFRFNRFWSVRNLDLVALIAFAPGLLWIAQSKGPGGYIWLFTVGSFFLVRLLLDPLMVRRPMLEPNLNASGLTFTGIALLVFLIGNVITGSLFPLARQPISTVPRPPSAYPLLYAVADLSQEAGAAPGATTQPDQAERELARAAIIRVTAVLAHLALVVGIVLVGYRHFSNFQTGVAMASLYLILPYTAEATPRVDHVVPAVLLIWAVAAYRRPALAGILIGAVAGLIGYPLFLLPLWCSFYWRRGLIRFAAGILSGLALLVVFLAVLLAALKLFGVGDALPLGGVLRQTFGWARLSLVQADGFWQGHGQAYLRIPVIAAYCVISGSMALWPAQKNLGTLMCCSAAVMLGAQFWHPYQGGVYMAWYLPLLVLTIFRPNLEDRLAVTAVTEAWAPWQPAGWIPGRRGAWSNRRKRPWLPWSRLDLVAAGVDRVRPLLGRVPRPPKLHVEAVVRAAGEPDQGVQNRLVPHIIVDDLRPAADGEPAGRRASPAAERGRHLPGVSAGDHLLVPRHQRVDQRPDGRRVAHLAQGHGGQVHLVVVLAPQPADEEPDRLRVLALFQIVEAGHSHFRDRVGNGPQGQHLPGGGRCDPRQGLEEQQSRVVVQLFLERGGQRRNGHRIVDFLDVLVRQERPLSADPASPLVELLHPASVGGPRLLPLLHQLDLLGQ